MHSFRKSPCQPAVWFASVLAPLLSLLQETRLSADSAAHAQSPSTQVVIVGMKMPPNLGEPYASAFQKVFPELAKENHAALCPFLLEGVGGRPDLNLPDRIHPSAKGQKILAENVWKTLQPLLAKLNSSN